MKKKLLLLLAVALLTGCSKKNDPGADTTIEYKYTADVSTTYTITYTGADNSPVTESFTGTNYDKVIKTSASQGFKWAQMQIVTTQLNTTSIHADGKILVNGKVADDESNVLDNNSNSITLKAIVFK